MTTRTPSPPTDTVRPREPRTETHTSLLFPVIDDRLGNLRIIEPIAAGGMAVVYKVKHEELEVIRAAKVLKPGFTEETSQRLFTEAKISANLHHPNIVQIYNVALWKEAVPYIEMEYVHGTSLKELITRHTRLPFPVAAAIGAIMCRALDFARRQSFTVYGKTYQGLVHRDIKPANILIAADGTVKLADFGIAQPGFVSIHTSDSVIMGTSPYLSPEQIKGEKLDHRSDIYSLGVVLYEMLTGIKAFPQPIMPALMHAKLKGKYAPIRSLAPNVPPRLCDIVEKSMMADKEKRFPDAGAFGDALERACAQFGELPTPLMVKEFVEGTASERLPAFSQKKRISSNARFFLSLGGALVLMCGILAGALLTFDRVYRRPAHPKVVKAARPAPEAKAISEPTFNTSRGRASPPRTELSHPSELPSRAEPGIVALTPPSASSTQSLTAEPESRLVRSSAEIQRLLASTDAAPQPPAADDAAALLARGIAACQSGSHDDADRLFDEVESRGSLSPDQSDDLAYYRSVNRDEAHARKPNAENRLKALRAWKEYQARFCGDGSTNLRCEKTAERVGSLERK